MKGHMIASSATIAGDITSNDFVYDPWRWSINWIQAGVFNW